jgi:hypothetical protein
MKLKTTVKIIIALVLGSTIPAKGLVSQAIFGEPVSTHGVLKQSAWFGWHYDATYPDVWHSDHGWFHVVTTDSDWIWLWNYSVSEWLAVHPTYFAQGYLFSNAEDAWLWYMGGGQGQRWFTHLDSMEHYREVHGYIIPAKMVGVFDSMMFADDVTSDLNYDLLEGAMTALMMAFMDPESSTCPVVTVTPEDLDLFAPPESIAILGDFGTGCSPVDGLGLVSGSIQLNANNIIFGESGGGANLLLTANNMAVDGVTLLNGTMGLDLEVEIDVTATATATDWILTNEVTAVAAVVFNNLQSVNEILNGKVDIVANLSVTERESKTDWGDWEETVGANITVTLTDLTTSELTLSSGTITLNAKSPGATLVTMNVQTNEGPIFLEVEIQEIPGGMLVNTVGVSNIMDGVLVFDNVLWDYIQCDDPISGTISFTYPKARYVMTFSGNCDGAFTLRKE